MTRIEYEQLRDERPELMLRPWGNLWWDSQNCVLRASSDDLVAACTARNLSGGGRHVLSDLLAPYLTMAEGDYERAQLQAQTED